MEMESHLPDHKPDDNGAPYKIVNQERKILNVQKYAYFFASPLNTLSRLERENAYTPQEILKKERLFLLTVQLFRHPTQRAGRNGVSHYNPPDNLSEGLIANQRFQKILIRTRNIILVKGSVSPVCQKSFSC